MNNYNLNLKTGVYSMLIVALFAIQTQAFGLNTLSAARLAVLTNATRQHGNPLKHAIVVLRHCVLTFDGEHKKRPFKDYIEDIEHIIINNREYFINEIKEANIPKGMTKEAFLNEFLVKLNGIKNCKQWAVIRDTLAQYTVAIPDLAAAFSDTSDFYLYLGINRRLRI